MRSGELSLSSRRFSTGDCPVAYPLCKGRLGQRNPSRCVDGLRKSYLCSVWHSLFWNGGWGDGMDDAVNCLAEEPLH